MTERITSEQFQNSDYKRRASRTAFNGEEAILALLRASGFKPVTQYQFHPTRGYKADIALLEEKIILEYDGAIWKEKTGHTFGASIERDMEKANSAIALGWRYLRFSKRLVQKPGYVIGLVNRCLQQSA